MKVLNKICRFAASVFGLASLVLFFMPFANIVSGGNNASLVGAILAFGGKATVGGTEYAMAKSSALWITRPPSVRPMSFSRFIIT